VSVVLPESIWAEIRRFADSSARRRPWNYVLAVFFRQAQRPFLDTPKARFCPLARRHALEGVCRASPAADRTAITPLPCLPVRGMPDMRRPEAKSTEPSSLSFPRGDVNLQKGG